MALKLGIDNSAVTVSVNEECRHSSAGSLGHARVSQAAVTVTCS